jgi:hypothetical protein
MTASLLRVSEMARWSELLDTFRDGRTTLTGELREWLTWTMQAVDPNAQWSERATDDMKRIWFMQMLVDHGNIASLRELREVRRKVGSGSELSLDEIQILITLAKQMRRSLLDQEINATIGDG